MSLAALRASVGGPAPARIGSRWRERRQFHHFVGICQGLLGRELLHLLAHLRQPGGAVSIRWRDRGTIACRNGRSNAGVVTQQFHGAAPDHSGTMAELQRLKPVAQAGWCVVHVAQALEVLRSASLAKPARHTRQMPAQRAVRSHRHRVVGGLVQWRSPEMARAHPGAAHLDLDEMAAATSRSTRRPAMRSASYSSWRASAKSRAPQNRQVPAHEGVDAAGHDVAIVTQPWCMRIQAMQGAVDPGGKAAMVATQMAVLPWPSTARKRWRSERHPARAGRWSGG